VKMDGLLFMLIIAAQFVPVRFAVYPRDVPMLGIKVCRLETEMEHMKNLLYSMKLALAVAFACVFILFIISSLHRKRLVLKVERLKTEMVDLAKRKEST
jgi:hypothetical protein